jgi:Skp family chaperone for outer membrane proteins
MKWFLFAFFYFGIVNCSISQEKFGIVDMDSLVNSILSEFEFNKSYNSTREKTFKLLENWIELFTDNSTKTLKSISCGTPLALEHARQRLMEEEEKLISVEKYLKDTLPNYKTIVINDIGSYLNNAFNQMGNIEKYDLIIDKKQIVYFDENISYQKFKIEHKINYKDEVTKIIEKFIQKTEAKYQEYYLKMKNSSR